MSSDEAPESVRGQEGSNQAPIDADPEAEREAQAFLDVEPAPPVQPVASYRTPEASLPRYQAPLPPVEVGASQERVLGAPAWPSYEHPASWASGQGGLPPLEPPVVAPERERSGARRGPETLEDLYAKVPSFGEDSEYDLYVTRIAPKTWRGRPVAGWVDTVTEKILVHEFAERFGGGHYNVKIRGPVNDGRREPDGTPLKRTVAEIADFHLAGDPVLPDDLQQQQRQFHMNGSGRFVGGAQGSMFGGPPAAPQDHPSVALKKLELEDARLSRPSREDISEGRALDLASKSFDRLAEKTTAQEEALRAQVRELLGTMRDLGEKHRAEIAQKDSAIEQFRQRLLDAERKAFEAARVTETEAIRDLRQRQEDEIKRVERDYASRVEAIQRESSTRLEDAARRWADDRARLEGDSLRERERLREDADRRERQATETGAARLRDAERNAERELKTLADSHARELQSLKNSHELAIQSVRLVSDSQVTVTRETSEMKTTLVGSRIQQLESELAATREELAKFRAHRDRPLTEQVAELKATSEALGLIGGPNEGGGEEKPKGFGERAADGILEILRTAADNAPTIIARAGEIRQANAEAKAQAQFAERRAAQQAQQAAQGWPDQPGFQGAVRVPQMPASAAPAPQPAAQARPVARPARQPRAGVFAQAGAPPSPSWDSPVPGPGAPPRGVPPVNGGVARSIITPPPAAPVVDQPEGAAAPEQTVSSPETGGQPSESAPPILGASSDPEVLEQQKMQLKGFFDGLENASRFGVEPEDFVTRLLEQAPEAVVRDILGRVTVEQLLALTDISSYLRKVGGRSYVESVWKAAKARLGM